MLTTKLLGDWGENLAAKFLKDRDYIIHKRNWRVDKVQCDLLVSQNNTLEFIEVKTRFSAEPINGWLEDVLTSKQLRRLKRIQTMSGYALGLIIIRIHPVTKKIFIAHYKNI
jgi:putative endonuclease